jgi:DNA-binding Lrp family transcriptional regulator
MSVNAYVLFKVSSGSEREICKKIIEFDGVAECSVVYGEYDLISKIKSESLDKLEGIIEKIRTIPSIVLTSTMIVARAYKGKTERNPQHKN